MHAEPTRPLLIAAAVLTPATLASVCRSPSFHRRGWQILDRWAFESPTQLRALEGAGEVILLGRLLEQQQIEHQALRSAAALEQLRRGMAEHEILALQEIRITLA
ncbi:TPA: hypothetical protein ACU967_007665 [Burkholderia contaminans]|uniref:hypothetical protein n=1 Tax=Pseudomonadota TaxID=1224 RepID=UPI000D0014D6|nr:MULTISPECIES: hypothetical protein [Pseudomonadota]MBM6431422.1 hypothetical protein [Burkholderia contaminans]MCA7881502.1 hypothetical protein [Burkholderia contaminans]MCA8326226.1 hypothetical protein [Burkholderia cepacia]MDN8026877.1 hypothetical protein [Burkholderia contaminans]NQD63071.1 hypothetical protein [Enterobacter sp. CM29]